ncbi:MAG: ATP-dependent DNA helicase, partial [Pseudomonadota bacterium]
MTTVESDTLADTFSAAGPLARQFPGYAPREPQLEMARAVARALAHSDTLVVEAGTGVGKTLAYLVPALLAGRRVIISTGTRNLQDQLFHRDLPNVTAALGQPVRTALLKGRSNYLCRYRLNKARGKALGPHIEAALERIALWAEGTRTGDIAEAGIGEAHPVWAHVTSQVDDCAGHEGPDASGCFVLKARRRAQAADLVVVNHHLLLADFALKEEGFGELLPGADACIVDEAHQLPEVATRFFGSRVSGRQISTALADLERELDDGVTDAEDILPSARAVRDASALFRTRLGPPQQRVNFNALSTAARRALDELDAALGDLARVLDPIASLTTGLDSVARRVGQFVETLARVTDDNDDQVRWLETLGNGYALHSTPLDAAGPLGDMMQQVDTAWVLTSATLAIGDRFEHFTERVGLAEPTTLKLGSPFDFEQHARLFLPKGLPLPSDAGFTAAVVRTALPLIEASGGSAFLLFTSRRALREAAGHLRDYRAHPILVQDDAPRDDLLRRFREHGRAVLLGTASFWEGVDVRGQALRLVVIDKLPFSPPGDPVTEARLAALRRSGVNPFMRHQVPEAVITLKQGVGRLIRDPDDLGVCVLCDPRVTAKAYG